MNVIDQGDRWLVYGTPYNFEKIGLNYCQICIAFVKNGAEIVGLGSESSLKINPLAKGDILNALDDVTEEQFMQMFGPRTISQMDGSLLRRNLEFCKFLYAGVINTLQRPSNMHAF